MKSQPAPFTSEKALSLLELLLSVGLILVLFTLSLVVIRKLKVSSMDVKCISNLRVSGTMLQAQITDSRQRLVSRVRGQPLSPYRFWSENVWRIYLKSQPRAWKVLQCPSEKGSDDSSAWFWYTYGLNMYEPKGRHYKPNPAVDAYIYELDVTRIDRPSTTVLLADSFNGGSYQSVRLGAPPVLKDGIDLRHNRKGHVFFFDGHLRAVDRQEATQLGIPNIYPKNP